MKCLPVPDMHFENKIVALSSIDLSDHTFRITTDRDLNELVESVEKLGLIHSPLLLDRGSLFTVLSGFRRIQAARHLGWPTLSARVADAGTEKLACAQFAIADNAQQRPLNLIEVSRALNLLSELILEPEQLVKTAASLALPGNLGVIKKIQKLSRLPRFFQELIVADTLSLPMALELGKIPTDAGIALAEIFNELRLSLGKQREIYTLIKEIALREDKSLLTVLNEAKICQTRADENLNRPQKTSKIRFYLKQRRFPILTEAQIKFEEFKTNLPRCSNFKLIPPAGFEGKEHVIQLNFSSLDELNSHRSVLTGLIENKQFKEYWAEI